MEDLFSCNRCSEIIKDPVYLPCCKYTICRKHLIKVKPRQGWGAGYYDRTDDVNSDWLKCPICFEENNVYKKEDLCRDEDMVKLQEKQFKEGECIEYYEANLLLSKFRDVTDTQKILHSMDMAIYDLYSEKRRFADLNFETMKLKLESLYREVIDSIDKAEAEATSRVDSLAGDIESIKSDADYAGEFESALKTIDPSDTIKLTEMKTQMLANTKSIKKKLSSLKGSLFKPGNYISSMSMSYSSLYDDVSVFKRIVADFYGKPIKQITLYGSHINNMLVLPNNLLAANFDKRGTDSESIDILDTKTFRAVRVLDLAIEKRNSIRGMLLLSESILVCYFDKKIYGWDLNSWDIKFAFEHKTSIKTASNIREYGLALSGQDGHVTLIDDVRTHSNDKELKTLPYKRDGDDPKFSPTCMIKIGTDKLAFAASRDRVEIWDLKYLILLKEFHLIESIKKKRRYVHYFTGLVVLTDGTTLVGATGNEIILWNIHTAEIKKIIRPWGYRSLLQVVALDDGRFAYDKDRGNIIIANNDGSTCKSFSTGNGGFWDCHDEDNDNLPAPRIVNTQDKRIILYGENLPTSLVVWNYD